MNLTPVPIGSDVQVNTFTTDGQPSVAALAGGGFVVTWRSEGDQDGIGHGIYGQRYAPDGTAVGGEFRVNRFTNGDQTNSSVTGLAGGGFVVTWASLGQDGSGYGTYGQRYAADGTAVGNEFRVNTFTASDQFLPSVAALASGGFVVTWASYGQGSLGQDGSGYGIYGQRYAADGTAVGNEFRVNRITNGDQTLSSVAALAGDGFVVTWASYGQDGSVSGIYGQRYAADGTKVGSEFQVNTFTPNTQTYPSVTALAGGGFVVTWSSYDQDGGDGFFGIYGQRYTADGTELGSEFRVNTFTGGSQTLSSVTAIAGGGFVVTWSSFFGDGTGRGIYGQRYAPDGTAVGSEFRINQITDGFQVASTFHGPETVATLSDGRLVQVWAGTGTEEVFFRLINVPSIVLDDAATTTEDTPVNIRVLANDGDFEGTPAITAITNGAHGTVAVNNNGTSANAADDFVVYTPAADFNGTDSFTYTVTSGGVTETATVSVTINAVQDAFDNTATVAHNSGANPINVLGNDFFAGKEQITAVTPGTSGTVAINDNGTAGNTADDFITYTPNTGFFGTDTFTYTVTSPTGTAETATVSVSVSPDVAPTALTDSGTVAEDAAAIAIDVLANDTDPDGGPKVTTTASDPAHGTVVLTGGSPGAHTGLTYQPDADLNGTDTFTYTLNGGSTTTVTVTVTPLADIVNDAVTVNEDSGTNNLNLLANDTFENPGRSITAVGTAAHGTTAINNNATPGDITDDFVVYTLAADFNGTDTFTYTVTSNGTTETAIVSVTVDAISDIVNDSLTIAQDSGAHNLDLLANDTFENPGRSITSVGAASHGTVTINNNGTPGNTADDFVVYAPTAGYSGADAFTYTATSGGVTETATVSVTVTALPPPQSTTPTSGNDDITGTEGPDTIVALAGDDIIDGLGAGDLLLGNQGNDTVFGRTGNDTIWGGQGNDSLDGAEDNDFLWGNEGADTIVGGDGANTIVGGQDSSDAADSITAGSGPDLIWGNGGADTITADGGGNTVIGGFGSDSIVTGADDDLIFGNQDNDTINGSEGANLIFGGFGDDSILTGSGNDTIWGNEGNDTMAAGTGGDRYVFLAGSGNDQINGFVFGEGDRLDLQGQTFTQGTSGDGDVLLTLFGGGTVELNGITPAGFSPTFVL